MTVTVGVVQFPGSNCDDDVYHLVDVVLGDRGMSGTRVWHKQPSLTGVDAVVLPGGFSYGDYLRAGAMAAKSPVMEAVREFAAKGGPVLGICNGFQVLCETGLLEGSLMRNSGLKFVCRDVYCTTEGIPTPFTHAIPAGRPLMLPVAHHSGCYVHPEPERLEGEGRVVFRYTEADGERTAAANPNGSVSDIAGVCNASGNVVGLMPHPERAAEQGIGGRGQDGLSLFESLLGWLTGIPARVGG